MCVAADVVERGEKLEIIAQLLTHTCVSTKTTFVQGSLDKTPKKNKLHKRGRQSFFEPDPEAMKINSYSYHINRPM